MRLSTRWRCVVVCAVCSLAALSAHAETKIYMQIEGIRPFPGEGTKPGSPWIVVLSVDRTVAQPSGRGTGASTEQPRHATIRVTKRVGASSPRLAEAAARGEHFKKVALEFVRVNAQGEEQVYLSTTLEEVIIQNYRRKADEHGVSESLEEITFDYGRITEHTAPQSPEKAPNTRVWEKPR